MSNKVMQYSIRSKSIILTLVLLTLFGALVTYLLLSEPKKDNYEHYEQTNGLHADKLESGQYSPSMLIGEGQTDTKPLSYWLSKIESTHPKFDIHAFTVYNRALFAIFEEYPSQLVAASACVPPEIRTMVSDKLFRQIGAHSLEKGLISMAKQLPIEQAQNACMKASKANSEQALSDHYFSLLTGYLSASNEPSVDYVMTQFSSHLQQFQILEVLAQTHPHTLLAWLDSKRIAVSESLILNLVKTLAVNDSYSAERLMFTLKTPEYMARASSHLLRSLANDSPFLALDWLHENMHRFSPENSMRLHHEALLIASETLATPTDLLPYVRQIGDRAEQAKAINGIMPSIAKQSLDSVISFYEELSSGERISAIETIVSQTTQNKREDVLNWLLAMPDCFAKDLGIYTFVKHSSDTSNSNEYLFSLSSLIKDPSLKQESIAYIDSLNAG